MTSQERTALVGKTIIGLVTLVLTIATILWAGGGLNRDVSRNTVDITKLNPRIEGLEKRQERLEERVDQHYNQIKDDLNYIKGKLQ